ncbi:hypothetical protein CJ240_06895 [Varibaculum cambriense]|uniref:Uncharacterized protein n=1 Tax=Varibaculum cambriense TaxID=184870 RepID=A0ABX4UP57_9ACTO|nr:hypothetical protein CJ240_06895 [Varibaculum cambriense]
MMRTTIAFASGILLPLKNWYWLRNTLTNCYYEINRQYINMGVGGIIPPTPRGVMKIAQGAAAQQPCQSRQEGQVPP